MDPRLDHCREPHEETDVCDLPLAELVPAPEPRHNQRGPVPPISRFPNLSLLLLGSLSARRLHFVMIWFAGLYHVAQASTSRKTLKIAVFCWRKRLQRTTILSPISLNTQIIEAMLRRVRCLFRTAKRKRRGAELGSLGRFTSNRSPLKRCVACCGQNWHSFCLRMQITVQGLVNHGRRTGTGALRSRLRVHGPWQTLLFGARGASMLQHAQIEFPDRVCPSPVAQVHQT